MKLFASYMYQITYVICKNLQTEPFLNLIAECLSMSHTIL